MNTVDFLVYVQSELTAEYRTRLTHDVLESAGVISANFNKHKHPHALLIEYDPGTIQSRQILSTVRRYDPAATMVGL